MPPGSKPEQMCQQALRTGIILNVKGELYLSRKRTKTFIALILTTVLTMLLSSFSTVIAENGTGTAVSAAAVTAVSSTAAASATAISNGTDKSSSESSSSLVTDYIPRVTKKTDILEQFQRKSYEKYIAQFAGKPSPDVTVTILAKEYTAVDGMDAKVVPASTISSGGASGDVVITGEEGYIEWTFDVEREGLYNVALKYYPIEGKSSSIERELYIDNELPFEEARSVIFHRIWANGEAILSDSRGNEYRPTQIEASYWNEVTLSAGTGLLIESFKFYLSEGQHTIRLNSVKEPMAIEYLKFFQEDAVLSYSEVIRNYTSKGYGKSTADEIRIQGESAVYKSDPTLYPINDRTSPSTDPYHVSKMILNTVGGMRWRYTKQWMIWEFEVPEDGLYKIAVRAMQNFSEGTYSSRKVLIDGKVPFKEVSSVPFRYKLNWQMVELGDGEEPYLFYLTKGKHSISLENTLGEIADVLRDVQDTVAELNYIYRKILMITGAYPDTYRDYRLEEHLPECIEIFTRQSAILYEVSERVTEISGGKGNASAMIDKLALQMADFVYDPDTIPERLDNYRINVSAMANWILTASEQPLTVDYIVVTSPDKEFPAADAPWWRKTLHEASAFFYSFIEDYSFIGDVQDDTSGNAKVVTLWMGMGRDQAQTMKSMIDDNFTPNTGIGVNLRLVDMGILLAATAAGKGPDLALYQGEAMPVNYALRNALYDLTNFDDLDEVLDRFADSAVIPFTIGKSVYAIPEMQTFVMMFYREDILRDLEIDPPQTWEDVYEIIPTLQKHYLDIGFPAVTDTTIGGPPHPLFLSYLYQNSGEIYNADRSRCVLNSSKAIEAFTKMTDMYTKYKVALKMDMLTRFRTGETPICITGYNFYNSLAVAAPEIKGLWNFSPIPGHLQPDGTIRREVGTNLSATILMKNAKNKEATWEFIKWWTSSEIQVRYGREMESIQGASARWPTANLDAMAKLPWPSKAAKAIAEQWKWVKPVPEIPGSYMVGRYLDNAIRSVINNGTNPRETLLDWVKLINDEIMLKRQEFGME